MRGRTDEDGRLRDATGRILPHQPNMLTWFRAYPFLIEKFDRRVTSNAWIADADAEGNRLADIACPCGGEPKVKAGGCAECPGEDCGRFYLFSGHEVWCANSPHSPHRVEPADA